MHWGRAALVAVGVLALSWAVAAALVSRLPPGPLRDLAEFLPSCVTLARRLRPDPRIPRRAKLAVLFAALWILSPIDLIPEFLPVIGTLVLAVALRDAARRTDPRVIRESWPGNPHLLLWLIGRPAARWPVT